MWKPKQRNERKPGKDKEITKTEKEETLAKIRKNQCKYKEMYYYHPSRLQSL